jgi:hypothetical protein
LHAERSGRRSARRVRSVLRAVLIRPLDSPRCK